MLPFYTWHIWTGSRWRFRAIQVAPENDNRVNLEMHSEALIQRLWRCTLRHWFSDSGDALGCANWEYLGIYMDTVTKWTKRYPPRLYSSEFGDALGSHCRVNLEAVIEQVWRYTWRPWSNRFRGRNHLAWEMHLQAIIIQPSSATTLVSVRDTQEFQTALTALKEPHTHWRRIAWVSLHMYLLYFAPEWVDIYEPPERQVCYTLCRGCSYAVAVCTTPCNDFAFLQPSGTCYLSLVVIYQVPHSPHIC